MRIFCSSNCLVGFISFSGKSDKLCMKFGSIAFKLKFYTSYRSLYCIEKQENFVKSLKGHCNSCLELILFLVSSVHTPP